MTRPSALPTTRTCCMCGAQMVEVRQSVVQPMRQDWQCPRCLHVEHDVYEVDDEGKGNENA